jgi:hypothetical protein
MNKREVLLLLSLVLLAILITLSCDSRNSITRSKSTASFSVDMTVVRDFSQGKDIAQARLLRNNSPFSDGRIVVGRDTLESTGNGNYFSRVSIHTLFNRSNQITFSSDSDSYLQSSTIDLPDSFAITSVNPRINSDVIPVDLQWSHSNGATKYLLVVVSKNYPADNSSPFMIVLGSDIGNYTVPDTTFEDLTGLPISGIYYIYMAAFNQGFGQFNDMHFPLPAGLPRRTISNPIGYLRYGTVAPVDSTIVLH